MIDKLHSGLADDEQFFLDRVNKKCKYLLIHHDESKFNLSDPLSKGEFHPLRFLLDTTLYSASSGV